MTDSKLLEDNKLAAKTKLDYLKSCDNYTTKEAVDAIKFLRNVSLSLGPQQVRNETSKELSDFMVEQGLTSLVVKVIRSLSAAVDDDGAFVSRQELHATIINIAVKPESAIAAPLKLQLVKSGIIQAVIDDLQLCDPDTKDSRQRIRIIDDIFRLQNMVLVPGSMPYYRKANSVDTLMKFVQANDVNTKVFSLRVLACIVNEEESEELGATGCIGPMIDMLRKAAESPEVKYRQYIFVIKVDQEERVFKSTLKTLTEGIVNLSSNDANKSAIVAYGGIPVLASVLRHEYTDDQKFAAAEALWKLAFLDSNRDLILNHLNMTDTTALQVLKEMQSSNTSKLRYVSKGLLQQLDLIEGHKEVYRQTSDDMANSKLLEDNKHEVKTKLDYLQSCGNYTTKDAVKAIKFIRNIAYSLGPGQARNEISKELTDFMVEQGLTSLVVKIIRSLKATTDDGVFESRQELHRTIVNIAVRLEKSIAVPFKWHLIKSGILKAIIEDLKLCDPNTNDPRQRIRIIDDIFRLQNMVLVPGSMPYYREVNSVDTLMKFVQANDANTKVFSLRVLACIVNEDESQRLVASGCMEAMIDMLRKAARSSEVKYRQYIFVIKVNKEERVFKSTLKTLTEGIVNLSSNDVNKSTIVAYGGIPVLASILRPEYTDDQIFAAAEALWKLAFLDSNRDLILNHLNVTDTTALQMLKKMQSSSTPKLRDASKGLLHQLGLIDIHEELAPRQTSEDSQKTKAKHTEPWTSTEESAEASSHVMISYNWDHQERALKVRDTLKGNGYNVWMDVDKMEGNILVAMANAVEKADVVLLCISRAYKASANCQTEANYTYRLKKPMIPLLVEADYNADGWLGALIAMKLYTRAYSDEILDKDIPALIRELGNKGRIV